MEYKFNIAWFVMGMLIVIVGALFLRYHQWIADNFGGGLGSYDRYKLIGIIAIGAGLVASINLHSVILGWIANMVFGGLSG